MAETGKEIGKLNGKWSLLLKIFLGTYPFIVLWAIWVTSSIFELEKFKERGDRFTKDDGNKINVRVARIETELTVVREVENPPPWFKERVDSLEKQMHENFRELARKIDSQRGRNSE